MSTQFNRKLAMLAACGTALGIGAIAAAQPYVINITGATLQQNFFQSLGSTQDFINVDAERGDTRSVSVPGSFILAPELQLAGGGRPGAATTTSTGWPIDSGTGNIAWWQVTYRAVGSGNGLLELARHGITPTTLATDLPFEVANPANLNRTAYVAAGVPNAIANLANPGASPIRGAFTLSLLGPRFQAMFDVPGNPSPGGVLIDIAPADVPAEWFIGKGGTASENATPGDAGYGQNPLTALNTDGTPATFTYPGEVSPRPFANSFGALPNGVDTVATHGGPVLPTDDRTIFSTPSAFVAIAAITNFGTGKTQATYSDLRHLFATGRLPSGENLMAITRDVDSGTRNAFSNSLRLDTSWCAGENIGALTQLNDNVDLGKNTIGKFQPSNLGGSGTLERAVLSHRLAIGHTGADRGVSSNWLTNGSAEVLAVKDDIGVRDAEGNVLLDPVTNTPLVGTQFVRPAIGNVLDNGYIGQQDPSTAAAYTADGYRIAGAATLNTLGDPRMAPISKGGYGYSAGDPIGVNNPPMRNVEAAAYVNNITRSVDAFILGADANFSPVDFLVRNFVLPQAPDRLPTPTDPTAYTVNPQLIQSVQDDARIRSALANADFSAYGAASARLGRSPNGNAPRRSTLPAGTYSDGLTGNTYRTIGGTDIVGATTLNDRNRISGDFDGNSLRNINDAAEMVRAYRFRFQGAAWTPVNGSAALNNAPGADICPEIIGDFDGNGSFDIVDVRYFADGLGTSVATGLLDRRAAFAAIDNAFFAQTGASNNFFGTTLATGAAYTPGASAADVAGPTGRATPGFSPIGNDGAVNAFDIDYIYRQFKRNPRITDGALNWSNLGEAVRVVNAAGELCGDLSADVNGDLVVNQADVDYVVETILDTSYGDVNLDGAVDSTDLQIAQSHLGQQGGWADGDVDGDGTITQADLDIIAPPSPCLADFNGDSFINPDDLADFITCFFLDIQFPGFCPAADFNSDTSRDPDDLADFITTFFLAVQFGC